VIINLNIAVKSTPSGERPTVPRGLVRDRQTPHGASLGLAGADVSGQPGGTPRLAGASAAQCRVSIEAMGFRRPRPGEAARNPPLPLVLGHHSNRNATAASDRQPSSPFVRQRRYQRDPIPAPPPRGMPGRSEAKTAFRLVGVWMETPRYPCICSSSLPLVSWTSLITKKIEMKANAV